MKIAFRFENGSSECILTPENARDKSYIDLCIDGRSEIRLKPTTSDAIILLFTESKTKSVEPQVINSSLFNCLACGKFFITLEQLKFHTDFKCMHDIKNGEMIQLPIPPPPYHCTGCGTYFHSVEELEAHNIEGCCKDGFL